MSPRGDAKPEVQSFGRRIPFPARIRSFSLFRIAALWEAFLVAAASLRQNKLRTGLTLVGIIVGVTAVIAVVTIIKGLDKTVATTFSSQGSTVFTVSKRPRVITSREDFVKFNKRKDVTIDDAEAIFRVCTSCWRSGIAANTAGVTKAIFTYTTSASSVAIAYGEGNALLDASNAFIASPPQTPPQTFVSATHAPFAGLSYRTLGDLGAPLREA